MTVQNDVGAGAEAAATGHGDAGAGFFQSLYEFVMGTDHERLIFVFATLLFALLLVAADFLYQRVTDRPGLLALGTAKPLTTLFFWPLGAAILALLCHAIDLLQATVQSSVVVSAAWTIYLPRVIESSSITAGSEFHEATEDLDDGEEEIM